MGDREQVERGGETGGERGDTGGEREVRKKDEEREKGKEREREVMQCNIINCISTVHKST